MYVTCFTTSELTKNSLCVASLKETEYSVGVRLDMRRCCVLGIDREGVHGVVTSDRSRNFAREIGASRRGYRIVIV